MDFCEFFRNIEADPYAITPPITVREFIQLRDHLHSCDTCYNRSERVLAKDNVRKLKDQFNRN